MPVTDFQSLLSGRNVPCYLNMDPGLQNAIELSLLQEIADTITPVNAWTPATPGGLVEWLKADNINAVSGSDISGWPNSAGIDATSSIPSEYPMFLTNVQNGMPMVRFNGTSSIMLVNGIPAQNTPFTIAIAFAYRGPLGTLSEFLYGTNTLTFALQTNSGSFTFASGTAVNIAPVDNNFHILFVVFNGASSQSGIDGAALVTGNPGTLSGMTLLSLGARSTLVNFSQVDIGEVIVWSGNGASFYNQAYNYLLNRWG